ncbi:MAG: DUF4259 domain-containing protein [Myxococcota bacterium]|nr:DUF4259 domain-containing protein [Myxococcota bacterium]
MRAVSVQSSERGHLRVWGTGSFENEAAMRWVENLEDAPDLEWVVSSLDEVLEADEAGDAPDPQSASRAIAAAETVAALASEPGPQLPEEVRQWCFDNPGAELDEITPRALQALGVVLGESELREVYEAAGELEGWEAEVEGLRDRLRG